MKMICTILCAALAISSPITPTVTPGELNIYTAQQLAGINGYNGNVVICADIEVPPGWQPIIFSGNLDGAGYTIHGLTSSLFERIDGVTIRDLTISNSQLHVKNPQFFVGVLSGVAINSFIENVQIYDASITTEKSFAIGGLIGYGRGITISNTQVENIQINSQALLISPNLPHSTGGLVGVLTGGSRVYTSTASGDIWSRGCAAGFVGEISGSSHIERSQFSGTVYGETYVAGFAGKISDSGAPNTISDCITLATAVVGAENAQVRRFANFFQHNGINGCYAYLGMVVVADGQLQHVLPCAYGADGADLVIKNPNLKP